MTTDKIRKDKNQNIQVFIRLRPLNQRERDIKSLGVVEVVNNREVVVRQSQQTSHTKKFTFDRAFGPNTAQLQVYQDVVSPLIEEVLAGYNCTVFAYGQTGTGKTHTMVGEHSGCETTWQNDPLAGIIPRALSQLFDELRLTNTEYTVRVSYLELYNEELFDLLSTSEDNSKLRIYEDVTRKGSNIVNGLEEITVYNKNEVYKIMEQGQERKRVASTLMNAQSSDLPNGKYNMFRSHTVFTIVIHMKENSPEGEELVKIGKLNLVDLAGSENISKAGSDNPAKKERARECVNINQSLLTLGRVITALVERHPHIPYRESKLTRILQESLGGRTKTSIIATISPGHKDLEETMSTLEYAHRAKNIQNKPEINQKMTKKAILKEYAEEIDRLKRDLIAARDKNGVYLANETFTEMTMKQEEQNKEIQELLLKKRAMEDERNRMENVFQEVNETLEMKNTELVNTKNKLDDTEAVLASTSNMLVQTKMACEEQEYLVQTHKQTETTLAGQARELLATADVATKHVACLHETVDKRRSVESKNLEVTKTYREQSSQQRDNIGSGVQDLARTVTLALNTLQAALDTYTTTNTQTQEQNKQQLENLAQTFAEAVNAIKSVANESDTSLVQATVSHRTSLHSSVDSHRSALQTALSSFLQGFAASLQRAHDVDVKGNVAAFVQQWYNGAVARVSSLQRAHAAFESRSRQSDDKRADCDNQQRDKRRANVARRANKTRAYMAEMEEENSRIEKRLNQKLIDIETERHETESRLEAWMVEERKAIEERLAKHVATEKQALEQRLSLKISELEEDKKYLEDRMDRYREWEQTQLNADNEELEMAEDDVVASGNVREEYAKDVKKYGKAFEEGTNAVSVDMEVFSKNVVEVVEHINDEMLSVLQQTKHHVEQEVSTVVATHEATCNQFMVDVDSTLAGVVDSTEQLIDNVVNSIEDKNTIAIQKLTELAASTSELISLSHACLARHGASSSAARLEAASLEARLRGALARLADLEGRYLTQEYKVYSPTGKTPSRVEYRYPRLLAASSPHQRILARFRTMRLHTDDDDCVVIEDSEARVTSDSECSREDSAVFAAPSPPLANVRSTCKIVKSTSETDIYAIRKQQDQGKENANRSVSHKKPSKLPAPSSLKKPLVERNGTIN